MATKKQRTVETTRYIYTEAKTTFSYPTQPTTTNPKFTEIFKEMRKNNLDTVKKLIEEEGVPLTVTERGKKTGAIVAAENGYLPMLKYFLDGNDTLLTVTDHAHNTVLYMAIKKGDLEMVKYLVDEKNANILTIDHHINTAVHVAAELGQLDILKYFIETKKADVNIQNLHGQTPLFKAAETPFMYIINYLIEERHADPHHLDQTRDNVLYVSAEHNDVTVPKYLLDTKKFQYDVNATNTLGYTLVNWASKYNGTEFVKYMVNQKDADMHTPDTKMRRTPLHLAALTNNMALCKFLVAHGANLYAEDRLNNTPAHLAENYDVVDFIESKMTFTEPTPTQGSRKRRRVFETMNIPHLDGPVMKSMVGNVYQYQRLLLNGNQETTVLQDITTNAAGALDGFLTMVDTFVRYVTGSSMYQRVEHESLRTPQEYLHSKMDPVAIYAIDRLPRFEE